MLMQRFILTLACLMLLAAAFGCPAASSSAKHASKNDRSGKRGAKKNPQADRDKGSKKATDGAEQAAAKAELPKWKFERFVPLPQAPEPSGLCFVPELGNMFLVDDGDIPSGRPPSLLKLDLNCNVLQTLDIGKDIEGVCWCGYLQRLLIADEQDEMVYIVEPKSMMQTGSVELQRRIGTKLAMQAGGNGIEGIEYLPDSKPGAGGYLLALNQDDPTGVLKVDIKQITADGADQKVSGSSFVELDQINAGEIRYYPAGKELWVIHSWMNITEVLDPVSLQLQRWEVMPGCAQEGVAFDADGKMWVGQDTGGIAIYNPLPGV